MRQEASIHDARIGFQPLVVKWDRKSPGGTAAENGDRPPARSLRLTFSCDQIFLRGSFPRCRASVANPSGRILTRPGTLNPVYVLYLVW